MVGARKRWQEWWTRYARRRSQQENSGPSDVVPFHMWAEFVASEAIEATRLPWQRRCSWAVAAPKISWGVWYHGLKQRYAMLLVNHPLRMVKIVVTVCITLGIICGCTHFGRHVCVRESAGVCVKCSERVMDPNFDNFVPS